MVWKGTTRARIAEIFDLPDSDGIGQLFAAEASIGPQHAQPAVRPASQTSCD